MSTQIHMLSLLPKLQAQSVLSADTILVSGHIQGYKATIASDSKLGGCKAELQVHTRS